MLGARFEAQPNALNLLRLLLASAVVVYHAARFRTHDLSDPVLQLLAELPVDGFFAISGFLICRSWVHRPDAGRFLVARATRLLPGLFAALVVTAFIVAPVLTNPTIHGQLRYVGENLVTLGAAGPYGLRDAVLGVPVETWGWWNQSLWTLSFEAFFYLLVAYLGISGRLQVRVLVAMAAVFWAAGFLPVFVGDGISLTYPGLAFPRLGVMFACGALLWLLRDRVPIRAWMLAAAVAVVCVKGHWDLPRGGDEACPLTATRSAR